MSALPITTPPAPPAPSPGPASTPPAPASWWTGLRPGAKAWSFVAVAGFALLWWTVGITMPTRFGFAPAREPDPTVVKKLQDIQTTIERVEVKIDRIEVAVGSKPKYREHWWQFWRDPPPPPAATTKPTP